MKRDESAAAQGRHPDWKDADTVGKDAVRGGVPRPQANVGLDPSAAKGLSAMWCPVCDRFAFHASHCPLRAKPLIRGTK